MATTVTSLVNQALRRIGSDRIDSITDDSPRAVLAAELWPTTRDEVLRDHEWSVAIERRDLAELAGENLTPFDYIYQLPEDPYCLRALELLDPADEYATIRPESLQYIIEGRSLYVSKSPLALRYIRRVENVSEYDPMLVEAMSLKLASKMAFTLTQSSEIETKMLQLYAAAVQAAQVWNATERWQGYRDTESLDQVRLSGSPRAQAWHE